MKIVLIFLIAVVSVHEKLCRKFKELSRYKEITLHRVKRYQPLTDSIDLAIAID